MASPTFPAKLFLFLLAECRRSPLDALALCREVLQPLLDGPALGDRSRGLGCMLVADRVKAILEGGVVGSRYLLLAPAA